MAKTLRAWSRRGTTLQGHRPLRTGSAPTQSLAQTKVAFDGTTGLSASLDDAIADMLLADYPKLVQDAT